jgi:hypothetical protein
MSARIPFVHLNDLQEEPCTTNFREATCWESGNDRTLCRAPLTAAAFMFCASPVAAAVCADLMSFCRAQYNDHAGPIVCGGSRRIGHDDSASGLVPRCGDRQAGSEVERPLSKSGFQPTAVWNGKYQQIGNGGFAGSISAGGIANAVSRGYATAGTDDGTSGPPSGAPSFVNNSDVLLDYGYRAVKATADNSKRSSVR